MEVIWEGNVCGKDIEIGTVVGRDDIGLLRIDFSFIANGIKNSGREKDEMRPYFF